MMKDFSRYSDKDLLQMLKEDSPFANEVFNIIYTKYSSQVYGYCTYRTKNKSEADELMQETWIKFFHLAKAGKIKDHLLSYMMRMARSIYFDKFRDRQRIELVDWAIEESDILEEIADPFDFVAELEREEFTAMIKIAISSLDEIYREPLALYWFNNFNIKEIASICEETEDCIRKRIERGFKKTAEIIKPYIVENKEKLRKNE